MSDHSPRAMTRSITTRSHAEPSVPAATSYSHSNLRTDSGISTKSLYHMMIARFAAGREGTESVAPVDRRDLDHRRQVDEVGQRRARLRHARRQ